MEETKDGCRIFVSKNLETKPIGKNSIKFDDKKLGVFMKHSAQIDNIKSSLRNVSIDDVEGQGPVATV
jgi:hypothetical protein